MNVTLYYVEGISRIDTPYFATKTTQASLEKQEEFFTSKIVKTIQLSYYPPHYRNAIRFDEDDLTINDNVNYLSLDYNGKKYYYFIDNINYISESLIEVEITMDVIQTYMFDIYIANGIIERKFIDRWNGNLINRNYVRENVSSNDFVYTYHNVINSNVKQWLVFVSTSTYYNMKIPTTSIKYTENLPGFNKNYEYISAYTFYIIPYYSTNYSGKPYFENPSGNITKGQSNVNEDISSIKEFSFYSSRNYVVDMFVCPFNCASGLELNETLLGINVTNINDNDNSKYFIIAHPYDQNGVTTYVYTITIGIGSDITQSLRPDNPKFTSIVKTYDSVLFNDKPQTLTTGVSYTSTRITQMFDENYIRFTFGSLTAMTTIPLYYLDRTTVHCKYAFNPSDGTRLYWILGNADTYDKYNTCILDTNIIHFDLKNDPWVEYVSANRSRWVSATVNTAVALFTKGASSALQNKFSNQEINDIMANPKSYDRRYKEPKLKTKPANMVRQRQEDIQSNNLNAKLSGIESMNSNIVSQFLKDANVRAQPATPKQISNISGLGCKDGYIMEYRERVQDYEQCAQYYHRNGFLVNEYINATPDIFGYVFNRYYFNILKMQLPNVHLHNVIEDEDTIQAITDRLVDGLRLWNVMYEDVSLGDFQYDNVELLYL